MKPITHVVENLARGGLERVVISLALAQRDAGHPVRVVCLFEQGALASELLAQGIPVMACDKRNGLDVRAVLRLRRLLREGRRGILHTHNAVAHYYAAMAAFGLGMRVVNTRHSMSSRPGQTRSEWLYRRSMHLTHSAVAVCDAARQRLAGEGVRPRAGLLCVPNGIHVDRFRPASDTAHLGLCDALGLPSEVRIVGTVGRLNRIKDHATLVRAFARMVGAGHVDAVALVLVGDGGLREDLQQLVWDCGLVDRVRFLGDRADVETLLPGFDVFAMSSVSEGYSMALLEACASGLPIVATDVGGNREIVHDGRNGRLVPAGDVEALAAALRALLDLPPAARRAMGEAGRSWVLGEGSFKRMADRYAALYDGAEHDSARPAAG